MTNPFLKPRGHTAHITERLLGGFLCPPWATGFPLIRLHGRVVLFESEAPNDYSIP